MDAPQVDFEVPAMSCGHCVRAITEAARRVDPDARVEADLPAHRVRIVSHADPARLREALAAEGYPPR